MDMGCYSSAIECDRVSLGTISLDTTDKAGTGSVLVDHGGMPQELSFRVRPIHRRGTI